MQHRVRVSVGPYAASPHRHTYDTRMIRRIIRLGPYACWRRPELGGTRASRKWPPGMGPICAPIAHNGSRETPEELESVQAELRAELEAEEGAEAHAGASKRPRTSSMPSSSTQQASAAGGSRQPSHRSCSACSGRPWTMPWSDHFIECGVPFRHAVLQAGLRHTAALRRPLHAARALVHRDNVLKLMVQCNDVLIRIDWNCRSRMIRCPASATRMVRV